MTSNHPIPPDVIQTAEPDSAYFACSCGSLNHLLRVTPDPDIAGSFDLEIMTTRDFGWGRRLWRMLAFIFGGGELIFGDVILDTVTAGNLAAFLMSAPDVRARSLSIIERTA